RSIPDRKYLTHSSLLVLWEVTGEHPAPDSRIFSELTLITVLDTAAVRALLGAAGAAVRGRTAVNLVTGTPGDGRAVSAMLRDGGAHALDGVMLAVPSMIGHPRSGRAAVRTVRVRRFRFRTTNTSSGSWLPSSVPDR